MDPLRGVAGRGARRVLGPPEVGSLGIHPRRELLRHRRIEASPGFVKAGGLHVASEEPYEPSPMRTRHHAKLMVVVIRLAEQQHLCVCPREEFGVGRAQIFRLVDPGQTLGMHCTKMRQPLDEFRNRVNVFGSRAVSTIGSSLPPAPEELHDFAPGGIRRGLLIANSHTVPDL